MDWAWGFWAVIVLAIGVQGAFWPVALGNWSLKFGKRSGLFKLSGQDISENTLPISAWQNIGWVWIGSSIILFWLALGNSIKF